MTDKWHVCTVCEAEYRVINSISDNDPEFCPFCGSAVDDDFDDDTVEDYEYQDEEHIDYYAEASLFGEW